MYVRETVMGQNKIPVNVDIIYVKSRYNTEKLCL